MIYHESEGAFSAHRQLQLYFDDDCGVCVVFVTWCKRIFRNEMPGLMIIPYAQAYQRTGYDRIDMTYAEKGVQLLDSGNSVFKGSHAIAVLLSHHSRLFALGHFLNLPLMREISHLVYVAMAANRKRISSFLGLKACRVNLTKS